MKHTLIYQAAVKILPESYDIHHYLSTLFSLPENRWVAPNNSDNQAYTICEELGAHYLIAMKREPTWDNGSFKGIRVYIYYNKELNYKNV